VGSGGGGTTPASNLNSNSYHERLGLAPDATLVQIRAAYKKLSKLHHPDVGGEERNFNRLNQAYVGLLAGEKGPPADSEREPIVTPADVAAAVMQSLLGNRDLVLGSYGRSLSKEKTRLLLEEMNQQWERLPSSSHLDHLFELDFMIFGHSEDLNVQLRVDYMKRAFSLTQDVVYDLVEGIKGKERDVICFWGDIWRYEEALGIAMGRKKANFGALQSLLRHTLQLSARSYNQKLNKAPDSPDLKNALEFIDSLFH
jgi:DnaJ domain